MIGYHFDEKKHAHTYDGKPLMGTTSVLKSWGDPGALVNWAANQAVDAIERGESTDEARKAHLKRRDAAGDKGKEIHAQIEVVLNHWIDSGVRENTDNPLVDKVTAWLETEGYTPIRSEMPVYNLDLWYGGIVDAVVVKDDKKFILDFKTSGTLQTKNFYQCGAYSLALKDMKEASEISGAIIVHIPRGVSFNPDNNVYIHYDISFMEQAFKDILSVYKTDQSVVKLLTY